MTQTMDVDEWWQLYYAHENDEDLPGQSSWDRYIYPRYIGRANFLVAHIPSPQQKTGLTNASKAVPLSIRFNCSGTFACTLSSLLIWPMEFNATATRFLAELYARQKLQYDRNYRQLLPPPRGQPATFGPSTATQLTTGTRDTTPVYLTLFSPDTSTLVQANAQPFPWEVVGGDAGETFMLNTTVAAQETASLYLCMVPSSSGPAPPPSLQLTEVSVTGTGHATAAVSIVRFKQQRITADGSVWANQPRLLIPSQDALPMGIAQNITRCLWVEVTGASELHESAPVNYTGTIVLSFGENGVVTLPLLVQELSVVLPTASPLWVGYMGALPLYPGAMWPDVRAKQLREMSAALAAMAGHGFTAATGGAGGPDPSNETLADISFAAIKQNMPHSPINSYLGSAIVGIDVRQPSGPTYTADVAKVITAVSRHAEVAEWPVFYQTVGDEPQGSAVDDSLAVSAAFKAARARLPGQPDQAIVGRTSVFTSVLNTSTDYTARLLLPNSSIELIAINEHSAEAISMLQAGGHTWMLYNGGSRFRAGFYLAMASHNHGCLGMYDFALSSVGADPYYALDAREDDLCAVFTTSSGRIITLLNTVQTLREGVNDLRYTNLLRTLRGRARVAASPRVSNAAAKASTVLAEIDAIPLGSAHAPWDAARISRVRRQVVSAVVALLHEPQ